MATKKTSQRVISNKKKFSAELDFEAKASQQVLFSFDDEKKKKFRPRPKQFRSSLSFLWLLFAWVEKKFFCNFLVSVRFYPNYFFLEFSVCFKSKRRLQKIFRTTNKVF